MFKSKPKSKSTFRWIRPVLIGLLTLAAFGTALSAAVPPRRAMPENRRQTMAFAKNLDLTREQMAAIAGIKTDAEADLERLRKAERLARLRLELALEENADDEKLAALVKEYETAAKALRDLQATILRKAVAVLNARQQARAIVAGRAGWQRVLALAPRAAGRR